MKTVIKSVLLIFLFLLSVQAQFLRTFRFTADPPDRSGLVGNGVTDLLWRDSTLYAGTGFGLSMTANRGSNWENFTTDDYGGKGGVSALSVAPDGTIWIATGYDTTVQEGETLSAGGGLRYLSPGSNEWVLIPQPKDEKDDTAGGKKPTTTHVQNVTFDIALLDTQVWIASWGGGVRRSRNMGKSWQVVTTDGKPFSSLDNLNHRGFSALAENGNIWIGTADGISKSSDGGVSWERYVVRDQQPEAGGISGGWVLALAYNSWDNSVWAVTLTTGGDEFNSVARTRDGGKTWERFLTEELSDGTFARSVAFFRNTVYVASEKGVFKSADNGKSWFQFPQINDAVSGESLLTTKFYSVAASAVPAGSTFHQLWVGSGDGLATTLNNGYDWTIFRSFISTRQRTDPAVYAYPNPFSPARGNLIRFQYDLSTAGEVTIDIYNFAMEKVVSISEFESNVSEGTLDRSAKWDGLDKNGRMVDNGVYFFRALVEGKVTWGKIVVIN